MQKMIYQVAAFCLLIPALSMAQTEEKVQRSIQKKIEVTEENGIKTVKVETSENGNTTTEVYVGDAADEYLNHQHSSSGNHQAGDPFHMNFNIQMDTLNHAFNFQMNDGSFSISELGLDSILKDLDFSFQFNGEMEEQLKKMMEEFKMPSMDGNSFQWSDSLIPSMKNHQMIILQDDEIDEKTKEELKKMGINIETEGKDGKKITSKVIVARVVLIEDMEPEKKSKVLEDVNIGFYPNPGNGDFTLEFNIEEEKEEAIISIHDLTGKIVYTETVKGKGNYKKQISLNEPSGIYILKIQQGKKAITKKLVIQ